MKQNVSSKFETTVQESIEEVQVAIRKNLRREVDPFSRWVSRLTSSGSVRGLLLTFREVGEAREEWEREKKVQSKELLNPKLNQSMENVREIASGWMTRYRSKKKVFEEMQRWREQERSRQIEEE